MNFEFFVSIVRKLFSEKGKKIIIGKQAGYTF